MQSVLLRVLLVLLSLMRSLRNSPFGLELTVVQTGSTEGNRDARRRLVSRFSACAADASSADQPRALLFEDARRAAVSGFAIGTT